ncbi:molybdopterin dehydrogenase FAD-binding protein [Sulfobacillus acidophilus TPY]|uniref:Carbon-monoxide dehydrogenase (Acceptor) n=1 Tax=Sulfobacillus acidophilus (strain ATCC 700253 / DSM 10332 / NAL) TaxID=679936 RepID=G8TYR7_SULAD|nr:molybdopterin dehydrogenase FAD-binding protein [Sulfobacillus acidophilus TPY]AEW04032.1 Carbon-monoxide dehydrogenase (acceptor) [Sulfobacillus acidophilus DSM 10332]
MFPNAFSYYAPETQDEAFELLGRYGYEGKVLAGGQSLLPMMKLRLAAPSVLIDINHLKELETVQEAEDALTLGALTRHAQMEMRVFPRYPLLHEAAGHIADPLVRNRGTMSGSLAHADPAADWGAALLAMNARVRIQSHGKSREVPLREFFVDTFTTVVEPEELVTAVIIPAPPSQDFVAARYLKLERKVGDFAVVAVAVTVSINPQGTITHAGIGLAAVGVTPLAATRAESLLTGRSLTPEIIREAAQIASEEADPVSDRRGSEAYKRAMVRVFVERGLSAVYSDWRRAVGTSA